MISREGRALIVFALIAVFIAAAENWLPELGGVRDGLLIVLAIGALPFSFWLTRG